MTERNRRSRGVLAGLLGTPSGNGDQPPDEAAEGSDLPAVDEGASVQPADSTPTDFGYRGGPLSGIARDGLDREAYEPGWYRVLASEPAEYIDRTNRIEPSDRSEQAADIPPAGLSTAGDLDDDSWEVLDEPPGPEPPYLELQTPGSFDPGREIDPGPPAPEPVSFDPLKAEPAAPGPLEPLPVSLDPLDAEPPHEGWADPEPPTDEPVDSLPLAAAPLDPEPAISFDSVNPDLNFEPMPPEPPGTGPDFAFEAVNPDPSNLQPVNPEWENIQQVNPQPENSPPSSNEPADPGGAESDPRPSASEPIPVEADPSDAPSPFLSLDAAVRRAALMELASRGLANDDDIQNAALLVSDPELDTRISAVRTLRARPDVVAADIIRKALADPSDEVRAEAVALEAARAKPDIAELLPFVAARRWPLSQQVALDALPTIIERADDPNSIVEAALLAVASMESSPVAEERAGFLKLIRVLGRGRLIAALDLPDNRRLGAARLLLEEGSEDALRAVAGWSSDSIEEVRAAAESAREQLDETVPPPEEPTSPDPDLELPRWAAEAEVERQPATAETEEPPPVAQPGPGLREIIGVLARALQDPDVGVRERAATEIGEVERTSLVEWTRAGLASHDHLEVAAAAGVAEAAGLSDLAPQILACAASLRPDERGPLVGALSSFGLEPDELVAAAAGVDANTRPDAIRLLWQVSGRTILPGLRRLLEDSSGPVRVAVLDVFGDSGDPSAIEVANGVLEIDSSPIVRATAIRVIGRAGLDQRTASLSQALDDPDPDVRATAVELLPHGLAGQAGDLLLKALTDDDDRVWQPAMRHLVSLPETDLPILWQAITLSPLDRRDALTSLLERTSHERLALVALDHLSDPNEDDRILAISLAARSGTSEATRGLIGTLVDPMPAVRRAGAAALGELRDHEAIPALTRALTDPDPEVREEALRALAGLDDERVLEPLIHGLKDPEERVRRVASDALVRWNSPAVARRLVEALTSPGLRRPASELLARMGTAAVDPLVNLLREGHPEIAATVGDTLEHLVGRDVFLHRLGSMDPADRMGAVEALGAMGGPEAVDGLIRALSDPNEDIRIRSLHALGELGDPSAIDAVRRSAQSDPLPEVAAAAEQALRKLQA